MPRPLVGPTLWLGALRKFSGSAPPGAAGRCAAGARARRRIPNVCVQACGSAPRGVASALRATGGATCASCRLRAGSCAQTERNQASGSGARLSRARCGGHMRPRQQALVPPVRGPRRGVRRPSRLRDTWRQDVAEVEHQSHGGTAAQPRHAHDGLLCGCAQVMGAPEGKAKAGGGISELNRRGPARMHALGALASASPQLALQWAALFAECVLCASRGRLRPSPCWLMRV